MDLFLFLEEEDVLDLIQDGLFMFYSRWRKYVGYLVVCLNVLISVNDGELVILNYFVC